MEVIIAAQVHSYSQSFAKIISAMDSAKTQVYANDATLRKF